MSAGSIDTAVIQARLTDAETALHNLVLGKGRVTVSYDGESVTFTQANIAELRKYIAELKAQLGIGCGPYRRGVRA